MHRAVPSPKEPAHTDAREHGQRWTIGELDPSPRLSGLKAFLLSQPVGLAKPHRRCTCSKS